MGRQTLQTIRRLALPCLLLLALHAHGQSVLGGSSTACDPTKQSCAPSTGGTGGGSKACPGSPGGSTCGGAGPAALGNTSNTNLGAGNPINIITGNKYQQEVDMPALPGVLGLEIVRYYNSQYSLPNVPTGVLGHGWKLSYETELYDTAVGIQIVQADGTRVIFQQSKGEPSHCTSTNPANGTVTILSKPQGKEYLWRWQGNASGGGRQLLFNSQGKLVQIAQPTGEYVSLLYSPKGWLLQVRDPQGRELNLNYLDAKTAQADKDGTQRFRGVQSIDSPVGRFNYGYGNELPKGSTANKTLTVANLTTVGIPTWHDTSRRTFEFSNRSPSRSSITRLYHYEDPRFVTLLTGISVQGSGSDGAPISQRLSTYGYDGTGHANLSQKADGIEKVTLDTRTAGQTLLTNSLGQKTLYKHTLIAGQWRLLESRGAGCAQCGPSNMRYGYDKLGRLTEQTELDPTGKPTITTRTTPDAFSRTAKIETIRYSAGKPGAAQTQVRYEYPSDHATEPSLIATPSVIPGKEHQINIRYNAVGQSTEITESGFEPRYGQAPRPIERSTRYSYQSVNGNSVLKTIDGPLPNGPTNSPQDSDITQLSWDKTGSAITTVQQPGGDVDTVAYDKGTGLLTEAKNAQGFYTRFVHNPRQQLVTTRSGGPGWKHDFVQSYRYDALGNATEIGDGEDAAEGKTFAAKARQGFDALGRMQWYANSLGILTHNRYDTESRLIASGRYSNAMAQVETVAVNALAVARQPAAKSLGPLRTWQVMDDFGRIVATISPDSGTTSRAFDAADRMIASTDAKGNQASYEYDAKGRIQGQRITDVATKQVTQTSWKYQGAHLVALAHPNQSERYEYDERGLRVAQIVTLKTAQGEHSAVTRYQFDDAGKLLSTSLPDGSRIAYERNAQGQVVALNREQVTSTWLRWADRPQTLVKDLQRDLVGIKHYSTGNGIEADFQRSSEGALARVVYRQTRPPAQQTAALSPLRMRATQDTLDLLLGVRAAHAAQGPGALALPADPQALLDHRYLWDERGNLLHSKDLAGHEATEHNYAYDQSSRLLAVASSQEASRYFYDPAGRRVLSQQGIKDQSDFSGTVKIDYQPNTHHWVNADTQQASYDANGQTHLVGNREYVWDALGKLIEIRQESKPIASYRYNHRGERISKTVGGPHAATSTAYLYEQRQLSAELNTQGQLTRQYIYLADQAIALIDTPQGRALDTPGHNAFAALLRDLGLIADAWLGGDTQLVWLHTNHLGAPEAASNAKGALIWRASYAPFGQATLTAEHFTLNLRLPGQYQDAETGLHYNRQRYYDPERGQYLTPDPLGTPNGFNGYAYVAYNPLKYIDPEGLILYAFDGTENTNVQSWLDEHNGSASNVVKFVKAYQGGGEVAHYITGVGTDYIGNDGYPNIISKSYDHVGVPDRGGNFSGPDRIDRMIQYLNNDAGAQTDHSLAMEVDIVGFSRGGAEARDFANQIAKNTRNGIYTYKVQTEIFDGQSYHQVFETRCQKVDFRFMGLFDTVLSTNLSLHSYQLGIPAQFKYVAQAVALNEYRSGTAPADIPFWNETRTYLPDSNHYGGFPLESIGASSNKPGQIRIELGFIGAHADIGGGYGANDYQLSLVALNWMAKQAQLAGIVSMGKPAAIDMNSPVIHDQSNALRWGDPAKAKPVQIGNGRIFMPEDRQVNGAFRGSTQRTMNFNFSNGTPNSRSMINADTQQFISYTARNPSPNGSQNTNDIAQIVNLKNATGTVDMQGYMQWLRDHGYQFVGDK